MIKLVRLDYRLLHGQVVFSWTGHVGAQRIIVVDDDAANDEMKKSALLLSKPAGVRVNIFTVDKAIAKKSGKANVPSNLYGKSISSAVTALNNAGFYNIAFCDQNGNPVSGNENATVTGVSPTGKQSTDSTITLTVSISGSGSDTSGDSSTTN